MKKSRSGFQKDLSYRKEEQRPRLKQMLSLSREYIYQEFATKPDKMLDVIYSAKEKEKIIIARHGLLGSFISNFLIFILSFFRILFCQMQFESLIMKRYLIRIHHGNKCDIITWISKSWQFLRKEYY